MTNKEILWAKTGGHCWYCGIKGSQLISKKRTRDHVVSKANGGTNHLDNLVPCCRSCNSKKGPDSIEDLRFRIALERSGIKQKYGVSFTHTQYWALKAMGLELPLPEIKFWFEENGYADR